ncbi:bifunctional diguanylate cyclase/phosphodiesterase [Fundidesulfovibrio butyratiphilus]
MRLRGRTGYSRLRDSSGDFLSLCLADGDPVCLIFFEIQDFYIFSRLYGAETAEALSGVIESELDALTGERLGALPYVCVDRLDADKFAVLVGGSVMSQEALQHTAALMRLALQARIKPKALSLTGQPLDVSVGASPLPAGTDLSPEHALYAALDSAQRMARGLMDSSVATLLREYHTIVDSGSVRSVYQPIVDLRSGKVFAWEALARGPKGSNFETPAMLFGFAEENNLIFSLEQACRQAAVRGFGGPGGNRLFLNVHPRTLVDPAFTPGETGKLLKQYGMEPHDVVLEITERHSTQDFSLFHRTLEHYRGEGFKVAVDDVGTGYSGLWSIAEIRPDFMKLDMSLIRGIDHNPVKRALIETFLTFSEKVGAAVITEGVETETELSTLASMGVHYGQGFYLACPGEGLPQPTAEASRVILSVARRGPADLKCSSPIGDHCVSAMHVPAQATVEEVKRMMEARPELTCAAVVDHMRPVGLIMRHHLDRMLSSRYGLALYGKRSVAKVMDAQPLVVDCNAPVEQAAQAAMSRDPAKVYDHVLVTREGRLAGLASVQRILDALAQVQMEMAKGANPLTGLPGNVAIERELEVRVKSGQGASFVYADLDNFKVYNDLYGFKAGDSIILLVARILVKAVRRHGNPGDFVGHVGGDDFLFCTTPEKAERVCRAVVRCFGRLVRGCYCETDRAAGYITGQDRSGREGRFPLVSVSLAIVDCQGVCSLESVSQRSAEMKKYAKSLPGNVYVRDRRAPLGAPESRECPCEGARPAA